MPITDKLQGVLFYSGVRESATPSPDNNKGDADVKAISQECFKTVQDSIDAFSEKNNSLDEHSFLIDLSECLNDLNTRSPEERVKVASKASKCAEKILKSESALGRWTKLWKQVEHFFRHYDGFYTEGEWGMKLASKLIKNELKAELFPKKGSIEFNRLTFSDSPVYGSEDEDLVFSDPPIKNKPIQPIRDVVEELKGEINELTDALFVELLDEVVLKMEGRTSAICLVKAKFYQCLSKDKKEIFMCTLLSKKDWMAQVPTFIEDSSDKEECEGFATDALVEKFLEKPGRNLRCLAEYGETVLMDVLVDKGLKKVGDNKKDALSFELCKWRMAPYLLKGEFKITPLHTERFTDVIEGLKPKINALSDKSFTKLVKDVLFKKSYYDNDKAAAMDIFKEKLCDDKSPLYYTLLRKYP